MAERELTLKLNIKPGQSSGEALKPLADAAKTTEQAVQRAMARIAASDPMAKMAASFAKSTGEMSRRIHDIRDDLAEVSSFKGIAKDRLKDIFGISEADEKLGRLKNKLGDTIGKLRRDAANFKIDGDPGPLLAKLNKVAQQVQGVKGLVNAQFQAAMTSGQRAMGGAGDLTRGLAMLSGNDEGMEKVVKKMIQVNAVMDTIRGAKEVVIGVVGGMMNLVKASSGMAIAAGMSAELAAAQNALAASHVRVATTANSAAVAEGRLTASMGAAAATSGGASAAGISGAAAAGGGAGIGTILGISAAAIAAIGAGVVGTNTFGSADALAGGNVDVNRILRQRPRSNNRDNGWFLNSTSWLDFMPRGYTNAFNGQDFTNNAALNVRGSAANLTRQADQLREDRRMRGAFGFTQADLDQRHEAQARGQFADRVGTINRNLEEQINSGRAGQAAFISGSRDERDATRTRTRFQDSLSETARGDSTNDNFMAARRASDRLAESMATGAPGTAAARQRLAEAQNVFNSRAIEADPGEVRRRLERSIGGWDNMSEYNQTILVEEERTRAAERLVEAQRNVVAAQREQRDLAIRTMEAEHQRYQEASRFHREQARSIRDAQRGDSAGFGLMDVAEQRRALGIAQTLAGGGALSREDIDFGRGIGPLRDMINSLGREQAGTSGIFSQIEALGRPGELSRENRAQLHEAEQARNQAIAVNIENRMEVEMNVNADATARELAEQVRPALQRMIDAMGVSFDREMDRMRNEQIQARQNQAAQAGGNR